ncbi:hypothetical protein BTS2_2677 [Bacillus sp. TS-2]|nr:hypothetical protein BTS2_2677 [Bacillus sp. TS-2]
MFINNLWLNAIFVFVTTFFLTYFLRYLLEGGDYSLINNWMEHLITAIGLTIGFTIIIKLKRKNLTLNRQTGLIFIHLILMSLFRPAAFLP